MNATHQTFDRARLTAGERVLLIAPPGELEDVAIDVLHRVGEDGRATAIVSGEPFLQATLPARLEVVDGDVARPRADGPFDAILAFGSTPFVQSFESFLDPLIPALRPGGRFVFELPCRGFSPVLSSCDPRGASWWLPSTAEWRDALEARGFRDVDAKRVIHRESWTTLAELLDSRVRAFPLEFENRAGVERQDALRKALAERFESVDELELALRFTSGRAIR